VLNNNNAEKKEKYQITGYNLELL